MAGKQELAGFIRSAFRSVWSLELLCLLQRDSERSWSQPELVTALRASDLVVAQSIATLVAAGLIVLHDEGTAEYRPASARLGELATEAAALYATSPDQVRRLIVSPMSGGLTAFADAFKVRKD
jgi:hypothetical protein